MPRGSALLLALPVLRAHSYTVHLGILQLYSQDSLSQVYPAILNPMRMLSHPSAQQVRFADAVLLCG